MAGFSGGRKLIAPGLAYQETIRALHSPRFMRDSNTVEGSIEHNPLHAELLEIAALAQHDFALDVALAPGRRICGVFAGAPRASHAAGIEFVRDRTTAWIPGLFDAAITSAAGYPLDLTFYQAVKGVTAAAHIVKPGGAILLVSECAEGAGAAEFSRLLLESPSPSVFLEKIEHASVEVDQWQLEKLALVFLSHPVLFYVPGLPAEFRAKLWGPAFSSAIVGGGSGGTLVPMASSPMLSTLNDKVFVKLPPDHMLKKKPVVWSTSGVVGSMRMLTCVQFVALAGIV